MPHDAMRGSGPQAADWLDLGLAECEPGDAMPDWSQEEVSRAVEDYFDMLRLEIDGEAYSKAERQRRLARRLNGRTPKAVGRKHSNISAVLVELGLPFIDGYKPLFNYQIALRECVCAYVREHEGIVSDFAALAASAELPRHDISSTAEVLADPPDMIRPVHHIDTETRTEWRRYGIVSIEAANRRLTEAGESLVLHFERLRLEESGCGELAAAVRPAGSQLGVQRSQAVVSFNEDGSERVIAVKTTRFCRSFPFLLSRHEAESRCERPDDYWLYRVFNFHRHPQLFMLRGNASDRCRLEPDTYRVDFGSRVA
ncbi:DUF3883 domain-containing protein [Verrucomicrobiota bacterium]